VHNEPQPDDRSREEFAIDTGELTDDEQVQHASALASSTGPHASAPISMGNDDLILYVRKQHPGCAIGNPQLGKLIWARIQQAGGAKVSENRPSLWSDTPEGRANGLPMVSTQFQFPRSFLPDLFSYLDSLGQG
jgi:hypothetical protein